MDDTTCGVEFAEAVHLLLTISLECQLILLAVDSAGPHEIKNVRPGAALVLAFLLQAVEAIGCSFVSGASVMALPRSVQYRLLFTKDFFQHN
jgi:hypothetical protein